MNDPTFPFGADHHFKIPVLLNVESSRIAVLAYTSKKQSLKIQEAKTDINTRL